MTRPGEITALVLAGGRGSRMDGRDKGLQAFQGQPLVVHALERLRRQEGGLVGPLMISANRHLPDYRRLAVPVWPDADAEFAGPLAGVLSGLTHCTTPLLLTVPCDCPRFPLDLARRLAAAMDSDTDVVVAAAPELPGGECRPQPVFALFRCTLREPLQAFLDGGGRAIFRWMEGSRTVVVRFDQVSDDPHAFANANTLADLSALAALPRPS